MAFDAISGQEWVFEVAEFQREVDAWRRSVKTLPTVRKAQQKRETGSRSDGLVK
jgi:hypothetical protein